MYELFGIYLQVVLFGMSVEKKSVTNILLDLKNISFEAYLGIVVKDNTNIHGYCERKTMGRTDGP